MSDNERDQQDDRSTSEDDAKRDLELKDDDADQIRGGLRIKPIERDPSVAGG